MIDFTFPGYDCSESWRTLPYEERMKRISNMVRYWMTL